MLWSRFLYPWSVSSYTYFVAENDEKRLIACSLAIGQAISLIKLAWGQPLIGVPHYAKDSITLPGNRQQLFRMLFAFWCRIYTIMSIASLALDKYERFWTFYPPGAFSRLLDFCLPPEFWINSMILLLFIPFLAPSRCPWAPSVV